MVHAMQVLIYKPKAPFKAICLGFSLAQLTKCTNLIYSIKSVNFVVQQMVYNGVMDRYLPGSQMLL